MLYKKVQEIGRGTFGIVDLVEDETGARWARKTFQAPSISGISAVELQQRFEREIKYQSQIDHPNVVKIHEYDINASPPWFIMEVAVCSLADDIGKDRTLSGDPGKPLFDILSGLEAMHERGYKHRDLKPANVLKFATEGGKVFYALSDFGLMSPPSGATSTLTASNMGGGTPLYAPPECVTDFKRATTQSDIYSFGAILHDIFSNGARRTPYTELSVPGPLNLIIQQCTKKSIRRRFKNVAILRQSLYEVLIPENIVFTSQEEEDVVNLLQRVSPLNDDEWDKVLEQVDTNRERDISNHNIFRVLSIPALENLEELSPGLFNSLGDDYSSYACGPFDFSYCDIVAGIADVFYSRGELELKARITLAMLVLGTSHNRWLVERKFILMAGRSISPTLAERIKIELEVQKIDFKGHFEHLSHSIGSDASELHPILQEMLVS